MVGYNADGPSRDRVLRMMDEKNRIESEIRDQTAILESNHVGMQDPLVDDQGYPRNDIDVYKVRHARHQIICLQNDHKVLMKRIEEGLAQVHSEMLPQLGNSSSSNVNMNGHLNGHTNGYAENNGSHMSNSGDSVGFGTNEQGFATVGLVHDGSPADVGVNAAFEELRIRARAGSGRLPKLEILRAAIQHIERLQAALRAAAVLESETCKPYVEPLPARAPPDCRDRRVDKEKPIFNNETSSCAVNSLARLRCIVQALAKDKP